MLEVGIARSGSSRSDKQLRRAYGDGADDVMLGRIFVYHKQLHVCFPRPIGVPLVC